MPKFVGSSIVVLSLLSCQGRKPPVGSYVSKDSVLSKYLTLIDSIETPDSNDLKYKILKSYLADDSGFFENLNHNLDIYQQEMEMEERADSCLQADRSGLQEYEEVYRFRWTGAFCFHRLAITAGKRKNDIRLDFIEYQSSVDGSVPCTVTRRFTRTLSEKEWLHLKASVDFAYFWTMETQEHNTNVDGSDWKIEGFVQEDPRLAKTGKYHGVYRHSPGLRAYSAIGYELLRLSGQKTHCFY
ncbi:MAG TPA: hypothetical protein VGM41_18175 [Chitinophagaceae bacterium]|jgi:hypothetical protein